MNISGKSQKQVGVLLPLNVAEPFDYLVDMEATLGSYVTVPIGKRTIIGVVWRDQPGDVARESCKEAVELHSHLPPMPSEARALIEWTANYNCASLGNTLKLSLSLPEAITRRYTETYYRLAQPGFSPKSAAQRHVLECFQGPFSTNDSGVSGASLKEEVSPAVLTRLVSQGVLEKYQRAATPLPPAPLEPRPVELSPEQHAAYAMLVPALAGGFSVHLLDGVTGSGKTEVYFEAIEYTLQRGKQVLVLLPEIALSVQFLERFQRRFGFRPAVWHSSVSDAERIPTWQAAAKGEIRAVVGARSALFLPYANLGLIVVDEEHDGSYKQEDGVIYHARDMAVVRARIGNFPLLLASATPSLETIVNCEQGKYTQHRLTRRYSDVELPAVRLIDMRMERLPASEWISAPLREAIEAALLTKRQALLFLNRRGYAPLLLCRACGYRFACPHCTAWLVLHRAGQRLECHHCGYREPAVEHCPSCRSPESTLATCGPGIERLTEEALEKFPQARILTLSSETLETPGAVERAIQAIGEGRVDIVIGTQLLAKGHHFPALNLVGVVDGDLGLQGGDPRAAERTYQLMHQLAGRAGREKVRGQVLLQTTSPEHPVMQALGRGDQDGFYALEKEIRRNAGLPPFGRLAALIVEGLNEQATTDAARALARAAPPHAEIQLLGPARAPLYKLRSRYRHRFLLKSARHIRLQDYIRNWLAAAAIPKTIRVKVDIDPMSFL